MYIKLTKLAIAVIVTFTLAAFSPLANKLSVGDSMPVSNVPMLNVDEDPTALGQETLKNGLLVIFSCNTCPFVIQWENRYNELYELCQQNEIGMVLVNSNEAKRGSVDSMKEMREKAKREGYKMKYLLDADHVVADAFGARTTPHVYLFNGNDRLAYTGSIDDNSENIEDVKETYLKDAIVAVAQNDQPDPSTTKSIGCSIKRVK